ncbi:MAG: carboxypeptidase-like regulatory domain-containing protein [Isosphaeraceae bacterium]
MSVLLMLTVLLGANPDRPDLVGRVVNQADEPLLGATAFIYTAAARVGINPYCPSCYADCAKSGKTDDAGAFVVRSLDPNLIFRVLVVREGYRPAFVEKVDPFKGPIRAKLMPIDKDRLEDRHFIRGRVVDAEGKPVVGAEISVYQFKTAAHWGFKPGIFDPVAVSNQEGNFLLTSSSPIEYADVQIKARGFAGKIAADLAPSKPEPTIALNRGAFLAGRVVHKGKPLPGVGVGYVTVNRSLGGGRLENRTHYIDREEIATDDEGRFLFSNVNADDDLYVYGLMKTLKTRGAVPIHKVKTGSDGTTTDVGDLVVQDGHKLAGRIVLDDGKVVPPHTRVLFSREHAWDSQIIELDKDGRFEATGLPTEEMTLGSVIRGYRLSPKNACASPLNPGLLQGLVDRDLTGLTILYEKGNPPSIRPTFNDPEFRKKNSEFEARRRHLIAGIPDGGAR